MIELIYVKQPSNEEKIRVNPLTGEIAESVWNDEDEKVKPKDKDLQHKTVESRSVGWVRVCDFVAQLA